VRVVADSGGLIAAMDEDDPLRQRCLAVLQAAATVFITPLVIAEVHHVVSAGGLRREAAGFLRDIAAGGYELAHPTASDYGQAADLIERYEGQISRKKRKPGGLDLADAMNVVVAAQAGTNLILATDQDYRAIRPLTAHPAFALLPADLAD
jgi:predicted nucleic acid-binding protein